MADEPIADDAPNGLLASRVVRLTGSEGVDAIKIETRKAGADRLGVDRGAATFRFFVIIY